VCLYCSSVSTHRRLRIRWQGGQLAATLEALGIALKDGVVELPSARIECERVDRPEGGPRLAVDGLPANPRPKVSEAAAIDVAAVGWGTVELDRAARELGGDWAAAPADRLLGASVRRSVNRRPEILLLEPDTEGRLAGALARYGEGPVALYLRVPDLDQIANGLATRPGHGPLGRQRLFLDGPPAGPFVLLVGGQGPNDVPGAD
jgi:hypothetical protein